MSDKGTVDVTLDQEGEELIFTIRDNGPGFDPTILDRIFEKFVTKSSGGTGLGLYLCREIIEAHGGRIWAQNNSGRRGAIITFTLPIDLKFTEMAQSAEKSESERAT